MFFSFFKILIFHFILCNLKIIFLNAFACIQKYVSMLLAVKKFHRREPTVSAASGDAYHKNALSSVLNQHRSRNKMWTNIQNFSLIGNQKVGQKIGSFWPTFRFRPTVVLGNLLPPLPTFSTTQINHKNP